MAGSVPDGEAAASRTEHRCPQCGRAFGWARVVCPADGAALRPADVPLPFVWLG